MAFASRVTEAPMVDINIIPLADVLLVLLIIFMVTAPTPAYSLAVDLPRSGPELIRPLEPPPPITLVISADGVVNWNGSAASIDQLRVLMAEAVRADPVNQPTLQIDVADEADYAVLAKVLGEAKAAQMTKIGFVPR